MLEPHPYYAWCCGGLVQTVAHKSSGPPLCFDEPCNHITFTFAGIQSQHSFVSIVVTVNEM